MFHYWPCREATRAHLEQLQADVPGIPELGGSRWQERLREFHEPANELPTGIIALFVLGLGLDLEIHREQLAALDVEQRGRHHQKLAGDFQVEFAHLFDVGDEFWLPDEVRDGLA